MKCMRCGGENNPNATVCARCGAKFVRRVPVSKPAKKGVNTGLLATIIALCSVLLIALIFGIILLFGGGSGGSGGGGFTLPDLEKTPCDYCGAEDHAGKDHPQCEKCGMVTHTTGEHKDSAAQEPVGDSSKENEQPKGDENTWGGLGSDTGTNKCEICGSTTHTTEGHPACTVVGCGSKEHDVYGHDRACKVCGKLNHKTEEHPKCDVCGSTRHSEHPKCDVCGSTAHTEHPSDKSK